MRWRAIALIAGPLAIVHDAPVKAGFLLVLAVMLTALTQIGGLVLWLCIPGIAWLGWRFSGRHRYVGTVLGLSMFFAAYLAASLLAVPLAGLFGRVPLPCGGQQGAALQPATLLICLANRHYVAVPVKQALQRLNERISAKNSDVRLVYLDAGFPFLDGFPMIPHLSHGDGRKIDLALIYENADAAPSPVGYWSFIQPRPGDPQPCDGREGWLRWDFDWLQPVIGEMTLDEAKTRTLLQSLATAPEVRRILIEPHLKQRLGLDHPKIRFQGCRAARHDDHIHVEF